MTATAKEPPAETKLAIRIDPAIRDKVHIVARANGENVQTWVSSLIEREVNRYDFSSLSQPAATA